MVDFELPYHSSKSVSPRDLREISIPLQDHLRVFLKQPVFVRGREDEGIFLITNCDGPIAKVRDGISRKFKQKIHSSPITVLATELSQIPEEVVTPPETPEEIINAREAHAERSAALQAYVDQLEQDKQGLIQNYEAQQKQIREEYQTETTDMNSAFTTEKSNLQTILAEQQRQNTLLEERVKGLMETLEGVFNPRSGPNSVICSSLSQNSISVKKLDRVLSSTKLSIPEILRVGVMTLPDYVNDELKKNLTLKQIEGLTERPVVFESTAEYHDLYKKCDKANRDIKLFEVYKSPEDAPEGAVRDYFASLNKDQVEKDIKNFEIAKLDHASNVELFDKIRDRATIWWNCTRAIDSLKTLDKTISLFVTCYEKNGNYAIEVVAPAGELDGKINGLLAERIGTALKKLELKVTDDKGLKRYVGTLPAETKDVAPLQLAAIVQTLKDVYLKSDLALVATLEVTELNRSFATPRTASTPDAAQTG